MELLSVIAYVGEDNFDYAFQRWLPDLGPLFKMCGLLNQLLKLLGILDSLLNRLSLIVVDQHVQGNNFLLHLILRIGLYALDTLRILLDTLSHWLELGYGLNGGLGLLLLPRGDGASLFRIFFLLILIRYLFNFLNNF